ncbi:MAG TPA: NADP-dependent malic enzyme [Candidatus Nanoarchaeia archaeon]|nr:NAD-dependent malic enzyme [uncultured archaeon]
MDFGERAIEQAKKLHGKIEVVSKVKVRTREDLSTAYTPGVASVSTLVASNKKLAYDHTIKGNSVAIISDGSAVLGLGNIGPEGALPVMEGKALLFKEFANIDAYPIVLNTQDPDEIIAVVKAISPGFAGINLEDISAPRCFGIEEKLRDIGIPVFHDDQHGTAIVILAALKNALKVVGKSLKEVKIVIVGAGAAGIATAKILKSAKIVMLDSKGPINDKRTDLNPYKKQILKSKKYMNVYSYNAAVSNADVFIGLSGNAKLAPQEIKLMAKNPIIFALSNPTPEILPKEALGAGAAVVATGRSDYPNQINNVLAFPGVFRGALNKRAAQITEEMKLVAAETLSSLVLKPTKDQILPSPLEKGVALKIAGAIEKL